MTLHDAHRMTLLSFPDAPAAVLRRALAECAAAHGVTVEQIMGPSTARRIAHARQDVFARLRQAG